MRHATNIPGTAARRGGIYVAVLGASMIVTIIGITALAASKATFAVGEISCDAAKARAFAESAVELGIAYIEQDAQWRTKVPSGVWASGRPIGDGTLAIEGIDPADGDLDDAPYDPLCLRGTGAKGLARHTVEVTLQPVGSPMAALGFVLHTGGELRVRSGGKLIASGAPASTNGSVRNDGTIEGNVEAGEISLLGALLGGGITAGPYKPLPGLSVVEMYDALATPISPGNTINQRVLSPGLNPWGATNPDGVYKITSASDVVIRDSRIHGTLVIRCPGCKVIIDDSVFLHPARPDYPVLVIEGGLELVFDGGGATLSESEHSMSFNPPGAPYEGTADSDTADAYPSEIRGLVHVYGKTHTLGTPTVRGTLIGDSTASSAVEIEGVAQFIYDEALYKSPPMGYTSSIQMRVVQGSWRQFVSP